MTFSPKSITVKRFSSWQCPVPTTDFTPGTCIGVDLRTIGSRLNIDMSDYGPANRYAYISFRPQYVGAYAEGHHLSFEVGTAIDGVSHLRTITCAPTGRDKPETTHCAPVVAYHEPFITRSGGLGTVSLSLQDVNHFAAFLGDFEIIVTTGTEPGMIFEAIVHVACLVLLIPVAAVFLIAGFQFDPRRWTRERTLIVVLLLLAIAYTDPVFLLRLVIGSPILHLTEVITNNALETCLLMFWLIFLSDALRHALHPKRDGPVPKAHPARFYGPKILLCGLLFVVATTMELLVSFHEADDPGYSFSDVPLHDVVRFGLMVLLGIYGFQIIYLAVRMLSQISIRARRTDDEAAEPEGDVLMEDRTITDGAVPTRQLPVVKAIIVTVISTMMAAIIVVGFIVANANQVTSSTALWYLWYTAPIVYVVILALINVPLGMPFGRRARHDGSDELLSNTFEVELD